jgi:hypothetical protein
MSKVYMTSDGWETISQREKDERTRLIDTYNVTLKGQPARVCGSHLPFAVVAQYPTGESFEYAWPTVQTIIDEHGGHFKPLA